MAIWRGSGGKRRHTAGGRARVAVVALVALLAGAVAVEAAQVTPLSPGSHRHRPSQHALWAATPSRRVPLIDPAPAPSGPPAPPPPDAVATIADTGAVSIPRSYLGLSIETWDLLRFDSHPGVFRRVLELLAVRGDGPVVLRIGGNSADRSWWDTVPRHGDRLPFSISPRWFAALRELTAAVHLRLLLDLNLTAYDPAMASAFVNAARAALPAGSIEAFEVGNEPDLYQRWWFERRALLSGAAQARQWGPLERYSATWEHLSGALYASAFLRYASALAATPLAGPALANPLRDLGYLRLLIAADRRELRLLTAHSYRYSDCSTPSQSIYPTIHRILSPAAAAGLAAMIEPAVRLAARAGLPFRLSELNSVSCGGRAGVSDTFATALWAPDALFALLRAGVAGINIHVRENKLNQAFGIGAHGLRARPLLYGLLAFARTLDGGRELLSVRVRAPRRDNISVWAVRTASGALHVLALDKGPRALTLALRIGARGPATVTWLMAPRIRATGGVRLGGQRLDAAGRWRGRPRSEQLPASGGGYQLHLSAYSGALLSIAAPSSAGS